MWDLPVAEAERIVTLADLIEDWLHGIRDFNIFHDAIFYRNHRIGYIGEDWAYVSFFADEFFGDPADHIKYLEPKCILHACDPEFFSKLRTEIIKVIKRLR